MTVALVIIGAGIFLFLGFAHAVFTLQSSPDGGPMMPTNPKVIAAMNIPGGLGMAPDLQTTLFRAWIGFNLSHSLGVIVIAGVVLRHAIADLAMAVDQPWFLVMVFAVPASYFLLAVKYWFDKPRNAIALATTLVWAGVLIEVV